MVDVLLLPMLHDLYFILVLSAVCVQCPKWLLSAVLSPPSQQGVSLQWEILPYHKM